MIKTYRKLFDDTYAGIGSESDYLDNDAELDVPVAAAGDLEGEGEDAIEKNGVFQFKHAKTDSASAEPPDGGDAGEPWQPERKMTFKTVQGRSTGLSFKRTRRKRKTR